MSSNCYNKNMSEQSSSAKVKICVYESVFSEVRNGQKPLAKIFRTGKSGQTGNDNNYKSKIDEHLKSKKEIKR